MKPFPTSNSARAVRRRPGLFLRWLLVMCACAATAAQAQVDAADEESYRLGPGDQIFVEVFNHPDLSGEYVLDGSGRFSMDLIGTVNAAGLTGEELERALVGRLQPDYLVNPRVSVRVKLYRPYYMMGEVASTGSFPYVEGMTYLEAIAIAGGYTYRAKKDVVFVIRAGAGDQEEVRLEVSAKVQPGDIVRIAERLF